MATIASTPVPRRYDAAALRAQRDRRDNLGLPAHDPAGGAGRRKAFERQRLAKGSDDLCWPNLLVLEHLFVKPA